MKENYQLALKEVLRYEGGFVDHPKDPGGRTNKGITQNVYNSWRRSRGLNIKDVKTINDTEVELIYRQNYWNPIKGDELPSGIDFALFDYAVNSGVSRAVKHLQEILKLNPDGILGPLTLKAIKDYYFSKGDNLPILLSNRRMRFLQGLKTWPTFGKGWYNRVASVVNKSVTQFA